MAGGLGRRVPSDFEHVRRFALTVPYGGPLEPVEKTLRLPHWWYRGQHDQGKEGACVGFGTTMMMAIINMYDEGRTPRYDPWWLWDRSKERDEWGDTNPGDSNGTSVRAACDVLRTMGHVRTSEWIRARRPHVQDVPKPGEGIGENRWARTVDEMRAVAALGLPMSIGINWYGKFDNPERKEGGWYRKGEYVIGTLDGRNLGPIRGGHCVCVYGASDRRQAFKIVNSWGRSYPLVWMPYETMQQMINEDGEVALVTDLPDAA